MVRPATRPANTGFLPDPHGDGGPPPEAAYAYVRQNVRIYERTAEHRRNRTQQAPPVTARPACRVSSVVTVWEYYLSRIFQGRGDFYDIV